MIDFSNTPDCCNFRTVTYKRFSLLPKKRNMLSSWMHSSHLYQSNHILDAVLRNWNCFIISIYMWFIAWKLNAYYLQRNHIQQLQLNNQLMAEVSELQQESLLIQEIPQRLCESVANCKDTYKEVFSIMQVIGWYLL